MSSETQATSGQERDSEDLARFGYSQELKRSLGLFSSFAVAFSYISPSTGIFTLFALGLTTLGGVFIWTWPVVALGQFIVALNFAEVSSHYPVAGSVFQWTKFLANRTYSWFTGWIYLFAGILTVTAVVATLPLALIPALNGLGWHSLNAASLNTNLVIALITLVVITVLNIYGVKLVSVINNTGVVFEILGMFVFALVLMAFHNHQGFSVVTNSAGIPVNGSTFLAAMFMSLFVIYGFDTASTLSEETKDPRRAAPKAVLYSVIGAFIIGGVFLLGVLVAIPNISEQDNDDPDDMGRVRVRYPALGPDAEGAWARIASVSAGNARGLMMLPVVGEEVLVGFEHDDTTRPYVLGSLFNGTDTPGDDLTQSQDGSFAVLSDQKIVATAKDAMNLTTKQSLTVSADQSISETAQQSYTIESQQGDISIKADMGNITIEGTQSVTIKCGGSSIQVGPSGVTVSGPMISLG